MPKRTPEKPRALDPQAGQAAFNQLEARLRAIPADQVSLPNSDIQDAAIAALNLVDVARDPKRSAKLAMLSPDLFAKDAVDQLEMAAWAAWYAHTQVRTEAANATGVKVDVAVYEGSGQHLAKLLKMLEYYVGTVPEVASEIADIRAGSGYQDRASDLVRTAVLWERYRADLEGDKRYFDPTDASKARTYAESIVQALRSSLGASAADRADLRNRAWTLMLELYNEVRAAGEFVFRNDPVELDFFLPLRQVVSPARPRKTDTPPAPPAPAPAPPPAPPSRPPT